jgi:hypothetical protein
LAEDPKTTVEEGDFQAGGAHSQEWQLRHKSLLSGNGVEESATDLREEGDTNGDGVIDENDEDADGDYDGDGAEWADVIDDAVGWADSDNEESSYGTNNWYDWRDTDITKSTSSLNGAITRVEQMASTDQNAQQLLTNYNTSAANLKQTLTTAQSDKSVSSFLALRLAQDQNMIDKSAIVGLDGQTTGDTDEQRWADSHSAHAQKDMEAIKAIQSLPPDQQQAALDKIIQQNPHSPLAREYNGFKNGNLSTYENSQTTLSAQAPQQQASNNTYDSGNSSYWDYMSNYSFNDYWSQNPLSGSGGTFSMAAAGTTTPSSPTAAPTGPTNNATTRPTNTPVLA